MPASRGRRHSGGGIRKRKNPNRQRLARVARSAKERDAKQQRRIAALRAAASSVGSNSEKHIPVSSRSEVPAAVSSDDESAQDTPAEGSRQAFDQLVELLATSPSPASAAVPQRPRKRPRPSRLVPPVTSNGPSTKSSTSEAPLVKPIPAAKLLSVAEPEQPSNAVSSTDAAPETGVAATEDPASTEDPSTKDDLDTTAAAREISHFGLDSSAVQAIEAVPMGTAYELRGVGRVRSTQHPALPDALPTDVRALALQPSVEARWRAAWDGKLDPVCGAVTTALRDFRDICVARRLPPAALARLRRLVAAHATAHVLRSRARVVRHDAARASDRDLPEHRDQGYARARVLFVVPMRNTAYELVHALMQLAGATSDGDTPAAAQVAHRARFEEEFGPDTEDAEFDVDAHNAPAHAAEAATQPYGRGAVPKPVDFRYTFRGKIDDDFKLGVALVRKQVKLYADFYHSDIIIASPLGLRRNRAAKAAGHSGARKKKGKDDDDGDGEWKSGLSMDKVRNRDVEEDDDGFLSSIEICYVDEAHVLQMQNWDSLSMTMQHINTIPASTRDTDFSRVRDWALDGLMKRFRQTVIVSAYRSAPLMGLFRSFENHAGRLCISEHASQSGSLSAVISSLRQTFLKVEGVESPADAPEKRIEHFEKVTIPTIRSLVDAQTLIVVPNYFDFVRVRNVLFKIKEDDMDFDFVSMYEYGRAKDVARNRARFFNKQVPIAVITERFHFYWRHWIRGVNTVVWYGLPDNAHYYTEFLNMTNEAAENGATAQSIALYDAFDAFALERIVGHKRCKRMIAPNSKSTFLFMS